MDTFDTWLQARAFNPFSKWFQREFHCNRFDLLKVTAYWVLGAYIANPTLWMLEKIQRGELGEPSSLIIGLCLSLMVAGFIVKYILPDLAYRSAEFEDGRLHPPSVPMEAWHIFRPSLNVVAVPVFLLILGTMVYGEHWKVFYISQMMQILTHMTFVHFLTTDDVLPKDRKKILQPAFQEA